MTITEEAVRQAAQCADRRALRILARSLARELSSDGLDARQLIALASELLEEATLRLKEAALRIPQGGADRP